MNTNIKVIGVGGAGCNAVSRMASCKIQGVELIAVNCDAQDLQRARAHKKIRIGQNLTKGLGAGMNPEVGKQSAEENKQEIKHLLERSDMVFITAGLGGGTGTGAAPVIAEMAKAAKALVVAVVTTPFTFEGGYRAQIAREGLDILKDKVDTLLIIHNDKVLEQGNKNTTLLSAFWACDEVLRQAVQGITDLILFPGIINVDFADVRSIMKNSGQAFFGIGRAHGEKRVETAANMAVSSPLLDLSIRGARGIVFNVSGGRDLSLTEINEAAKIITEAKQRAEQIVTEATNRMQR